FGIASRTTAAVVDAANAASDAAVDGIIPAGPPSPNVFTTQDSATYVITNTLNNQVISHEVDFNVFVENFDFTMCLLSGALSARRIANDQADLGALN
ncbi:MAG: hypothetical protein AB7P23_10085, partial [Amphiplicatus sp.]